MLRRLLSLILGLFVLGGQAPAPSAPPEGAQLCSFYYHYYGMMLPMISGIDARLTQDGWEATFLLGAMDDVEGVRLTDQDVELLTKLVEDHNLWAWTGFDESNSMILDGEGFSFAASFDTGLKIEADGSNSFPEGYYDAQYAILNAIEEIMIAHEIVYQMEE